MTREPLRPEISRTVHCVAGLRDFGHVEHSRSRLRVLAQSQFSEKTSKFERSVRIEIPLNRQSHFKGLAFTAGEEKISSDPPVRRTINT